MEVNMIGIKNVTYGKNFKVVFPSNLYECEVGNNCFVGPFVEIQKNAKIGNDCRIQSHSFICEGVTIDDNCFIGHGVMFINDTFAMGHPAGDPQKWKETKIGKNVSIGSNATILPSIICDNVVIGAGAVVTKNIKKPGIYVGNPAKYLRSINAKDTTR